MSNADPTTLPDKLTSHLLADGDDLREIVVEFVEGLSMRVTELKAAHQTLDWEQLRTLAHRLKGAGGSYGYPQLSELGKRMEEEFKDHRADDFNDSIRELQHLVQAANAGLLSD